MADTNILDEQVKKIPMTSGEAVKDKPIAPGGDDTLDTKQYAEALADHIKDCVTPLTVGIQGEWGSGKTSLLNMIQHRIETELTKPPHAKNPIVGKERYKTIWVNTWEHSLLKTPEECLLSIIGQIIDEISAVDKSWNSARKAKSALSSIAKGAVRIGATAALGTKGGDVADEMLGDTEENSVKVLRKTLNNTIADIARRNDTDADRFIIFIDDLDRLEPPTAVMVLELLKNIFDLDNCVFVVAIDYQVVVKGLEKKFGKPNETNEWEFRAFFDKIIQLPFMMPMANYKVNNYLTTLLRDVKYFDTAAEAKSFADEGWGTNILTLTIGKNPRSLKRLVNSLSLIKKTYAKMQPKEKGAKQENDSAELPLPLKKLVLAFVCVQISFPLVFELFRSNAEFYNWDEEFVNKVTGGGHREDKDLSEKLARAVEVHEEDFDSEWEKSLFKIVWFKKWQRNKVVQISKVLSLIEEDILQRNEGDGEDKQAETKKALEEVMRLTAVTTVASTDEAFTTALLSNEGDQDKSDKSRYWQNFRKKVQELDTNLQWHTMPTTMVSNDLGRDSDEVCDKTIMVKTSFSSSKAICAEIGNQSQDDISLYEYLKENRDQIAEHVGMKLRCKTGKTVHKLEFSFPEDIAPLRKNVAKLDNKIQEKYLDAIVEKLPIVEEMLIKRFQDLQTNSGANGHSERAQAPDNLQPLEQNQFVNTSPDPT